MKLALCGCGALGSWLGLFLASPEHDFILIDDDRVGGENIATSAFSIQHVGASKAVVLSEMMYRKCKCIAVPHFFTFTEANLNLLAGCDLVIDTFDNLESRRLLHGLDIPTVHAGVSEARTGEVAWDEGYVLPDDGYARGDNPICTHELGKRILRSTAAITASVIEMWLVDGTRANFVLTERMEILCL